MQSSRHDFASYVLAIVNTELIFQNPKETAKKKAEKENFHKFLCFSARASLPNS
jgi:hypothetical protein